MALLPTIRFCSTKRPFSATPKPPQESPREILNAVSKLQGPLSNGRQKRTEPQGPSSGSNAGKGIGSDPDLALRVMLVGGSLEAGRSSKAVGPGTSLQIVFRSKAGVGAGATVRGDVTAGVGTNVAAASLINRGGSGNGIYPALRGCEIMRGDDRSRWQSP